MGASALQLLLIVLMTLLGLAACETGPDGTTTLPQERPATSSPESDYQMVLDPVETAPGDELTVRITTEAGDLRAITGVGFGLDVWTGGEYADTGWIMVTGLEDSPSVVRAEEAQLPDLGLLIAHDWPLRLPEGLTPGWYRVRAGVIEGEPARSVPVYGLIRVVEAAPGSDTEGDTAIWNIESAESITPDATSFTALVERLRCADGETGRVQDPVITAGEDEIVITFSVEALPAGFYTCPGNDRVPYLIELGEQVGQRRIVDGACRHEDAAGTSHCVTEVRWSP